MTSHPKNEVKELNRLVLLKRAILFSAVLFVVLLALGVWFQNTMLSVAGLMFFTALSGLLTYYIVLTET